MHNTARGVSYLRPYLFRSVPVATLLAFSLLEGQEFRITEAMLSPEGEFSVAFTSSPDSYYILRRGADPAMVDSPRALTLGTTGPGQLGDRSRVAGAASAFYRVQKVPQSLPLDTDGDGLDDYYELLRAAFLNPLNQLDAAEDYDGDGKSNLQEYLGQTNPAELPVDPATAAPPLEPGVQTSLAKATSFLYTGPNPIQTGVTSGTFDPLRVCVLRGKVHARDGAPLTGVTISILGHPEFGRTRTRADGMFDLVVNGGGQLTVNYERPGYCPAQRRIQTPWAESLRLPDVAMIMLDSAVTPVVLGTSVPTQIARGSPQVDADGRRQATLLLAPGTAASLVINGATQNVGSLNIRATEFTVGVNGPATMPAQLPASSAYTYCVDLTADEATAAGASTVQFDRPLAFYVENFLNFPVGQAVPTGYYDREKSTWVASQNGRVIQVLSATMGVAAVDTDGDGAADSPAQLAALGVTQEELERLASLYLPRQTLWRVPITHFSPWDCNWPGGPPPDAKPPPGPGGSPNLDNSCPAPGSIIEIERQALGEDLELVGTPYRLHYHSDRARGYLPAYTVRILLSEAAVPESLKRIDLEIEVAGRLFKHEFPPAPDQQFAFTWDGLDAYGRSLGGTHPIKVRVGYVYNAFYYAPGQFDQAFAAFSDAIITGDAARDEITLWNFWSGVVGNLLSDDSGLGNWTLDVHHAYDSRSRTLHFGDGRRRSASALESTIIQTFAGGAFASPQNGDGGPATAARLVQPAGLAVAPDGSLYIAENLGNRVRKVAPDGTITTIAGSLNGTACPMPPALCGDGGPATSALLNLPQGLALAPDGTLYIAERIGNRVRKVDTNGVISTVAGTGVWGYGGDDGPAIQAQLREPFGVSVAPDGSLYIADTLNARVRRITADGIIRTVVGTGITGFNGDGRPALQTHLNRPYRAVFGPDQNLYIVERNENRVRKVGPDGLVSTVAGSGGISQFAGDGGAATLAKLNLPEDIAFTADGSFYIGDTRSFRVRFVGTQGIITTIAGNGIDQFTGDGGPATQAAVNEPGGLATGPDGSLFISQWFYGRVRKVASALPGSSVGDFTLASDDGTEVYVFDNSGRHLRTLDAFTKAARYQFSYDPQDHLSTITDGDSNVTTIERDGTGRPRAVVSPYGQRTALTLDANGYLASVANPAGEKLSFEYTSGGLLTTLTNPRTNRWQFFYDALGRLTENRDPAGGFKALGRAEAARSFSVELRTAMQRTNRYEVINLPTGGRKRVNTFPDGLRSELWESTDGSRTNRFPTGVVVSEVMGPDPRWGMLASLPRSSITTFPNGPTNTVSVSRSVSLADPNDPLSLTRWTETTSYNGRSYVRTFSAGTKTETNMTPAGRRVVITYDSLMRPAREEVAGLAPTFYTYDLRGRLSSRVQGLGPTARTNLYFYDTSGYLTNIVDPLGRSTILEYDLAGRVKRTSLPGNLVIQNAHDPQGNLVGMVPPGRPLHSFSYSPVDRLTAYLPPEVTPGISSTRYDFDADQRLARIIRSDGQSMTFNRVGNGCYCDRLDSVVYPHGTRSYHYDALTGNLAMLTAPDGVDLTFTYSGDLLNQQAWHGPVNGSVTSSFDNDLFVASRRVNSGAPVTLAYDADKLLTRAGDLTLTRDAQNSLISGTALGRVIDSWSYNEFAEPTNYTAGFGETLLYSVQITRDALGRIAQKTETIGGVTGSFAYVYDSANRLTHVTLNGASSAVYEYDVNGNPLSIATDGTNRTGVYDDQDRLLALGAATYTWTANGDLDSKSSNGQTTRYTYDTFGNLRRVVLPAGTTIDYLVDGFDRRVAKQVNGVLVRGFLYENGLRPVAELDGAGNVVSEFVYGARENVPEYMLRGGQTYRIICDNLDSPRLIVNIANGQIAQRIDYDAFGRVLADTAPGFQPFGFAGGLYDGDTALVRFGVRDYDAGTGRWTARDPILFEGGQANLYAYVGNDPLNRRDPAGLADPKPPFDLKKWQMKNAKDLADCYKRQAQDSQRKKPLKEYEDTTKTMEKAANQVGEQMNKNQQSIWDGIQDALSNFGK